jgi:hypothetical protein
LVGRRPFSAPADVHVIRAILEEAPKRPSETNKAVPVELDDIVMNLLEKDREKRVPNAAKLAARLQRVLPPTQGNPLAKFIEKMSVYDDDPPEQRVKTGGGRGIPAVAGASDSTDVVVRDATVHAELVATDEAARETTMVVADRTLTNSDEEEVPSTGGSGNHAATVLVARREAQALRSRDRRRVIPLAAGLVAIVIVVGVAVALRSSHATSSAVDAGIVAASVPRAAASVAPVDVVVMPVEKLVDAGVEDLEPPVVPLEPRPASAGARAVQASAPERIRWTTMSGRALGNGTKTLQVPDSDRTIIAIDPKHDARVVVTAAARIDWAALPEATITVRVLPYATEVKIGTDSLGPTPVQPRSVVAGVSATYKVIVTKDKATQSKLVKLKPGEDQIVAFDLRK